MLDPGDAAALDALMDAGLDLQVIEPSLRDRAARVDRLLKLLDGPKVSTDRTLVDLTMVRVSREASRRKAVGVGAATDLDPDSAGALDAWIDSGYDLRRVAPAHRERAARLDRLASLATSSQESAGSDLVERTLGRVQAEIDREQESLRLRPGTWIGVRWRDLVSVAAVLLLAASVIWPVLSGVQQRQRQAACASRLAQAGLAMGSYALANDDSLPALTAGFGGSSWWNVGKSPAQSNSANLFTLARTGFASLTDLACPGNHDAVTSTAPNGAMDWRRLEEVSFSYQLLGAKTGIRLSSPTRFVVLVDRSPVVLRAVRGEPIDPWANSPNHRGRGQHVLRSDGSAEWMGRPAIGQDRDNLWLPRSLEEAIRAAIEGRRARLQGNELPDAPDDAFVGP